MAGLDDISLILAKAYKSGFLQDIKEEERAFYEQEALRLFGDDVALSATTLTVAKEVRLAAFDRFSTKPNGTFPTARPDSGQAWKKTQNPPVGAALQVIGGKLTNTVTATGTGAGYAELDMTAPVTRVGAKFVFQPGGSKGADTYDYGGIEIGVWKEPISTNFPVIPNSPCHLVVYPEYWNYGVWDRDGGGMLQSIKTVFFATPLAKDGATVHTIDVRFDGATAYLTLPDGTTDTITDARILSRAGNWAQWEVYQQNAAVHTKAAFTEVWADTEPYTMQAKSNATVNANDYLGKSMWWQPATSQYIPAPTSMTEVSVGNTLLTFTAPATGRAMAEANATVEMSAAADMYWDLHDGTTAVVTQQIAKGLTNGRRSMRGILSGLTPGASYTLKLRHFVTVSGAGGIKADLGTGCPVILSVTPIQ